MYHLGRNRISANVRAWRCWDFEKRLPGTEVKFIIKS